MRTFHLSDKDCKALRAKLQSKATETLAAMDFAKHDAYATAIRLLHETQLEAFQERADHRAMKRAAMTGIN